MIIFNDSISRFCHCTRNLPRQSANAEAFAKPYLFFSICFGKKKKKKEKNADEIKFLGILEKMSPRTKYVFVLKKSNVLLK